VIVPTVPIVPHRRDRLTYAVLRGTVPSNMIVLSIVPSQRGTVGGRSRGQPMHGDRPRRIRLTYAVFARGGAVGDDGDGRLQTFA